MANLAFSEVKLLAQCWWKKQWSQDLISDESYSRIHAFICCVITAYITVNVTIYLAPDVMLSSSCTSKSFNSPNTTEVITYIVPVIHSGERWRRMGLVCPGPLCWSELRIEAGMSWWPGAQILCNPPPAATP